MAEQEGTQVETTTPAPEMGAGAPDAATMQAELELTRKALKAANAEAAGRRKELDVYVQAEQARKEAEMSEVEKALKRATDAEAALQAERGARQAATLKHAVAVAAIAAGFHNPDDAWAFLPQGAVTLGDNDKAEGVDEALKELVKARPYLVKSTQPAPPPGADPDASKRGLQGKAKPDQAAIAAKYGIKQYPTD